LFNTATLKDQCLWNTTAQRNTQDFHS